MAGEIQKKYKSGAPPYFGRLGSGSQPYDSAKDGAGARTCAELFFYERRTRPTTDVPLLAESFTGGRAEIAPGIFLITVAGSPSADEFGRFLDEMAIWLDAMEACGERVALIVDPGQLTRFDAHMRRSYGQWRAAHRPLIEASCTRAAYVTRDAVWRGIMTAVFWFAKPAIPVELCESRQVALEWLKAPATVDP